MCNRAPTHSTTDKTFHNVGLESCSTGSTFPADYSKISLGCWFIMYSVGVMGILLIHLQAYLMTLWGIWLPQESHYCSCHLLILGGISLFDSQIIGWWSHCINTVSNCCNALIQYKQLDSSCPLPFQADNSMHQGKVTKQISWPSKGLQGKSTALAAVSPSCHTSKPGTTEHILSPKLWINLPTSLTYIFLSTRGY